MRVPFDSIGSGGGETSIAEHLFRAWKSKEITDDEYFIGSAKWIAENTDKYAPRAYPALADNLRSYTTGRVFSGRPYDPMIHKKVGMWTATMLRLSSQNTADFDLLVWASKHLAKVRLVGLVSEITQALKKFESFSFPSREWQTVLASQKMDNEEKQALARRGAS